MGTKKILNKDVSNVVEESLAGYLMAYRKYYKKVGEYNAFTYKGHRKDKVALVIGGGSGHEPLFTGYCGAGLADAVACGNVCASPNPELIMEAAKAVDQGRNVVEYAHERGASVEAELGHILTSKAGAAEGNGKSYTREEAYTDPEMAKEFIERTNVDALAIGFGTAHGIYTEKPVLDLNRIALIKSAKDIPYVMHGGSGLSEEEYRTAIHNGIRKINYYTYLSLAGGRGVMQYLEDKKDKDAIYFEDIAKAGITAMKADVKRAMKIFESDGKI